MKQVALLSMVTASVAFTLSEAKVCAGLRRWARDRSSWLETLVSCGYCLGYWVAFALVVAYRPRLFDVWFGLDYFLTALVVAWLAAFQWGALCWLMEKAGK